MNETQTQIEQGIELLEIGVGVFDPDLSLAYCNSAFRSLRHYPEDVCRPGATLVSLLRYNAERGDFGAGPVDELVAGLLAEIKASDTREREREMADGQVLGITYRRTPTGGLVVAFRDRTAERTAQRALRLSEERYSLISDAAEEAIYEWDIPSGNFFSSPRLQEILGRTIDEGGARNWGWDDIVHPDDLDRYRSALEGHLSGTEPRWKCEYRIRHQDGTWRWVLDHGTSVRGPDGRAVRMVAAIRDISDRIERDAALAASEERLALVMRATSDGIYDWDVTNDLLYVSDNLTRLLDFDLGSSGSGMWAERVHNDDYPGYVAAVRAHFRNETEAIEHDYRVRARGGGYRWVHDRGVGLRDANGRVTRLVGAVRDITEIRQAQSELEETRGRMMQSLSSISEGILLVDADNRVELWNDRYAEIFSAACGGADMAEVIVRGRDFFDMIRHGYSLGMFKPHPGGVDAWVEARQAAWNRPLAQLELGLANGAWILLNEHDMPDGGRVSVYTDITEFKRREAETLAARQRFEEAIEAITSGFALWDADDRLVISNARFRSYFADLADMVVPGNLYPDVVRAGLERGLFPLAEGDHDGYLDALVAKRAQGIGEVREQFVDGVWLQVTDHRTKEGGIVSIYTDITELKTKQTKIEEQAAILELTMENMVQGISLVDEDLRTTAFNSKFLDIMDFPPEVFKRGFTMEEAFRYNAERGEYGPGDVEEQVRSRLELAAKFQPHRFERTKPDGTVIEIVGNPVTGGGFVSTYTDITELKRREAEIIKAKDAAEGALGELQKAQDQLIQSEKMASLGQLTAGIAHEIKNPLNFVNNFAKLSDDLLGELAEALADPIAALDDDDRDDAEDLLQTVRENLVKISEHGARADSIVRNMLLHSREGPSERQTAALNPIAEEAMNLAYHGARAEDPRFNVDLEKSLDAEVGNIECFPQDLMRVFLNLFTNAMYAAHKRLETGEDGFTPKITLTTRRDGPRVEVEVRDNGPGIPDAVKDKIFLPFFTTKPTGEGTGLGLSLSYDIVTKQHGGTLSVESAPGAYTAFLVSLPRQAKDN